uniref:Uncharacterized protein n=1 Tax=Anguilla anguilla TaxID=7936 RepID=A0A0E9TDD8_ANGAN
MAEVGFAFIFTAQH